MSSNIATEIRRISDARSRLKSIIDQQARAQAAQLSPDNFKYQTNATLAQSDLGLTDDIENLDAQGSAPISGLVPPQSPIEPDLTTLTMWMSFSNLGNQDDLALMGHTGNTRGGCSLVTGPTGNDNNLVGGTRAIQFDGATSYVDVLDAPDIRIPASGGFSFAARIYINDVGNQTDEAVPGPIRRTLAAKQDSSTAIWSIATTSLTGSPAPVILFHVRQGGSDTKIKSANLVLNTWYDLVCTYNVATKASIIYVNNTAYTTADTSGVMFPTAADDLNLHIGRANYSIIPGNEYGLGGAFDPLSYDAESFDTTNWLDPVGPFDPLCFDPVCFDIAETTPHSTIYGGYKGAVYDPRMYNVVLTATQVGNLYTNKFSISSIPLGASANAGYCLSHS